MIERSRVRIPAGAAGEFSSRAINSLSFYTFHTCLRLGIVDGYRTRLGLQHTGGGDSSVVRAPDS